MILYDIKLKKKEKIEGQDNFFGIKEDLLIKQAEMTMQRAESEFERELAIKKVELDLKQKKLDIDKELFHLEVIKNKHQKATSTMVLKKNCMHCNQKIELEAIICPLCGLEDFRYTRRWRLKKGRKNEKMTLFQIEIRSDPDKSSPFVKGINTIVIPSSLFLNSKLISRIKIMEGNEYLADNEILMSLKLEKGDTEFILLEQVESSSSIRDGIEFVITKKNCPPEVAEELLNLILEGLFNETMGKEVLIGSSDNI